MRSDAFDQQRELWMKEGWRGEGRVGREGFWDESCAEDGHDNDDDCCCWCWCCWEKNVMMMPVVEVMMTTVTVRTTRVVMTTFF